MINAADFIKWLEVFNVDYGPSAGTGSVDPGLINELSYYAAAGDTVSGLTTANNGLLVTSAAGVPSIGNAVLSDITINGVTVGKGLASVSENTVVGEVALDAITTGGSNTAMGYNSLTSETTGSFNTAYGRYSCRAQNGESYNTGIGMFALESASGSENTVVGANAGRELTADRTVAIGFGALQTATSGLLNLAIGANTLKLCTTPGNWNIFIGSESGGSASFTGARNVALGKSALLNATSSDSNCSIGFNSFINITTGDGNVGVGDYVGFTEATGDVAITTGGHNTLLGTSSGANDAACDGAISLGHSAVTTIATGASSSDNGPGMAIGSIEYPVGFRGDGSIYPTAGAISGYMIQKINGVQYKVALYALS